MQSQVGDHTVPPVCRVFVVLNAADAVGDPTIGVALLRLSDHPVAEVDPQHLCRALFRRILTVPPIPTPQVQHGFALQRRKQRLQLMPLPRRGQPALAAAHLGVFLKEMRIIVFVVCHRLYPPSIDCLHYTDFRKPSQSDLSLHPLSLCLRGNLPATSLECDSLSSFSTDFRKLGLRGCFQRLKVTSFGSIAPGS